MCRTGGFVERGIKAHHGYGSERFRVDPRFAVRLDPALGDLGVLLEPTSVVAKAWDYAERLGARAWFERKVALITGRARSDCSPRCSPASGAWRRTSPIS
jgi:hypothetical protein